MTTKVKVKEYPVMGAMLVHGIAATAVGVAVAMTAFDSSIWAITAAIIFGNVVAVASGWYWGGKYPRDA